MRHAALALLLGALSAGWLALREPLRVTSDRIEQARTLVIPPQVRTAFAAVLKPGDPGGRLLLHTGALRGRMLRRHLTELTVSAILRARYSDEELLRAYLDSIYMGRDGKRLIIGIREGSLHHFGKDVRETTNAEAAMLAAIHISPGASESQRVRRRDRILQQMTAR